MIRPFRSLQGRFLLISLVTGLAVLLVAGWAIGEVIRDVVMDGAEEVFAAQQDRIRDGVDANGRFHPGNVLFLREFSKDPAKWGWVVKTSKGIWRDGTTRAEVLEMARSGGDAGGHLQLARGRTAAGRPVHIRLWNGVGPDGQRLAIMLIGSDTHFRNPFLRSRMRLWAALGVFAICLAGLVAVQLRYGFAPVRELRRDLADVRAGRIRTLSENLPDELRPLAREINALIAQNDDGLQHARLSLANLAHSLKTPLATLLLRLPREGASDKSLELLQQLDTRIRHHLARARSGAQGAGQRAQSDPRQVVGRLIDTMHTLNARRNLSIVAAIDADLMLGVDPEDLEEMMGNLLENACRFAGARITITTELAERNACLVIEDDGPGLEAVQIDSATKPGMRFREDDAGYGFGLGLVDELANLYGGGLRLSRSALLGGLRVDLTLPQHIGLARKTTGLFPKLWGSGSHF